MKVKVNDIKPNPYRQMDRYPIDREKVRDLKNSIEETGFWDNILTRKNNKHYEPAYGHHRLIAIQELDIKEIDIPVKEIGDADMLRIMANENYDEWKSSPAVINETVLAAKEFIEGEMQKASSIEYLDKSIRVLFEGVKGDFQKCKKDGVGRNTLLKFLGRNWKQWMIQEALETIKADQRKEKPLDRKAVETMPTVDAGRKFKIAMKKELDEGHTLTRTHQKAIAKDIREKLQTPQNKDKEPTDIKEEVSYHADIASPLPKKKQLEKQDQKQKALEEEVNEITNLIRSLASRLRRLQPYTQYIKELGESMSLRTNGEILIEVLSDVLSKIGKEVKKDARKHKKSFCKQLAQTIKKHGIFDLETNGKYKTIHELIASKMISKRWTDSERKMFFPRYCKLVKGALWYTIGKLEKEENTPVFRSIVGNHIVTISTDPDYKKIKVLDADRELKHLRGKSMAIIQSIEFRHPEIHKKYFPSFTKKLLLLPAPATKAD